MIEKLSMKDFRSHEDTDIELNQGLNIFLGEVGAGKTSILEALSFALFGRYAGSVNRRGLIRRGAEKAEISLTFTTSSGRYRVDRTIYSEKAQQAKMMVFDGGKWKHAVEGATAVSKSVEEILNVDASTFLAAIYASQSEIKEMLETQPGKRRERLDKLLGIDMYEKIWKTLGEVGNIVLKELTVVQDKASGVNVYERQLQDINTRVQSGMKELGDLRKSLKDINGELKPTERRLKDLNSLKEELSKVKIQIEGKVDVIKKSIKALKTLKERRERAEKAASIFDNTKEFIDLEKTLKEEKRRVEIALQGRKSLVSLLQRDERDLQQEVERRGKMETLLKSLKALEEDLKTLKVERRPLTKLMKERSELEGGFEELKVILVEAFNEIVNQKRRVSRVVELGECPTCLQTVPAEHKERIRMETKVVIVKLENEYRTLKDSKEKYLQQLEELKEKMERADAADRQYSEKRVQAKMLEDQLVELKEVETKIKEIKTSILESQKKIDDIKEDPESLEEIDKRLEEVIPHANLARESKLQSASKKDLEAMLLQEEKKNDELKVQLSEYKKLERELSVKYDAEKHSETERDMRVLREERAKAIEGTVRLERSMGEEKQQITRINKILHEKRKANLEVEKLRKENNIIDKMRQSLRQVVQPVKRKNNVLNVSEAFQSFYQELSNDTIDYAAIDEDGNVDITRNGEPSPVNSLSGGETTCAALALRLAISSSLTKNQLLLLDEPTIHLDELYRAKLRDFLGYHRFEQLIVVTHDNTFDSLPAKVFRVEKKRGESIVSPLSLGGR